MCFVGEKITIKLIHVLDKYNEFDICFDNRERGSLFNDGPVVGRRYGQELKC